MNIYLGVLLKSEPDKVTRHLFESRPEKLKALNAPEDYSSRRAFSRQAVINTKKLEMTHVTTRHFATSKMLLKPLPLIAARTNLQQMRTFIGT